MKNVFMHRSGKYYYRLWIPKDLRQFFLQFIGTRPDIAYSLKTIDHSNAQILALKASQEANTAFTLLRTGVLSNDQAESLITSILPKTKPKPTSLIKSITDKPTTTTKVGGKKLSTLWSLYKAEHCTKWTEKSALEFQGQFHNLLFAIGDKNSGELDRALCVGLRDTLLNHIPPNREKKKIYRDLTLDELIENNNEGLHPKTVNKHMSLFSSVLKWSVRHGYEISNPSEGLTLEKTSRPDEERLPYDLQDLQTIINNLHTAPEPAWIPIVAMFSGARREEICSLVASDIINIKGIMCFNINEQSDRHLKTASSTRIVPVHPQLIKFGFLEYVQQHPAGNLWNLQQWRGVSGKVYGNLFGKWNRKHITGNKKKVFHSFRHNVADALKQSGVADIIISELLGHENGDISTGRYGKRLNPERLLQGLIAVQYDLNFTAVLPLLK